MKNKNIEKIKSLSWTILVASATIFAACSNDDNILEEQPVQPTEPQVYNMTVEASKGGDEAGARATNRALSLDGSTLNATWSALTDNVYVKKGSTWATGSLQPQADGTTATLKGTLSGITIEANDALNLQFPKSGDISYDGQLGTLADIAANFDYATATVDVGSVSASGNIVPKTATTSFTNQQTIIKFTLKKSDGWALPSNPTAFTISDGTNTVSLASIPAATYTANGTGVLYVAFPAAGTAKTITLTATIGLDTYTYEKTGVTFTNGRYYAITVKMTPAHSFTIDDYGTKIMFAPGNLQYNNSAATYKWRFAEHQYDYIGAWNTSTWVDLLGWGTWTGSNPNPSTNTNTNISYYTWISNDFTKESLLVDESQRGYNWRTLNNDEWNYVFIERSASEVNGCSDARYAKATVASKAGIILFPDSYTHPLDVTAPVNINQAMVAFTVNQYSASQWQKMESAGAVFLPAAGSRTNTSVSGGNLYGYYWSSYGSYGYVYYVRFSSSELDAQSNDTSGAGRSVRLVRPVE